MRTEVVMHATDAIHELMIALQQRHVTTPVRLSSDFDEFNLEADSTTKVSRSSCPLCHRPWKCLAAAPDQQR